MKMPRLLFPIFSFLLLFHFLRCTSQHVYYVPDVNLAVDCGFSGHRNATDGRRWTGDVASQFSPSDPPNAVNKSMAITTVANTVVDDLYRTVRLSRSPFTYSFPATAGPKFLRLYFLPKTYDEFPKSDAFFTVKTGKFTLLKNFSAALVADSSGEILVAREFCIHVAGETPKLDITFTPSPNSYAFVNGIEVVSMPKNLYYSQAITKNTALELYYRINLGGNKVLPSTDSGMYRTWEGNNLGVSSFDSKIENDSVTLNYTDSTPNFTATDSVYQSAIIKGKDPTFNSLSNFSWGQPVHVGFNYLVRLHFCLIQTTWFQEKQSHFTVNINRRKIDTIDIDSVNSPMFRDYYVLMADGNTRLSIDLHPLPTESYSILNGIEVFKQSNGTNLAVPNPPRRAVELDEAPAGANPLAKKSNEMQIIAAVCGVVGFAILFSLIGFFVIWKQSKTKTKRKKKKATKGSLLPETRCRSFTFDEILEATDYFNTEREIGVGGFGAVYRGVLEDEEDLTVAVKRLNPDSRQGAQEFKTEIELLSELRHFNLVSLIGYCIEGKEMLLIYEFMQNGTFKDHLYDTPNPLPWKKRLKICYGAARGLNYLHTGLDRPIIHRDVKTTNILLDENWVAKVSDFGMSKLGQNNTAVSTAVKGTWGYLDPEYHRRLQVTEKSDVYSFGVVLFEVLCGRKPLDPTAEEGKFRLTLWAKKCLEKGTADQIIDPKLKGKILPECLKQYLKLAVICINDEMKNRPTMAVVEDKLRSIIQLQEEADKDKLDGELNYPEEPFSPVASMGGSLRTESYKTHVATVLSDSDVTASMIMSEELFETVDRSTSGGTSSGNH